MLKNPYKPDASPVSFGRYIKAIRIQKGIDLQTVSTQLRISLHQLYLIESEDHEELKDVDFVRDALCAYADFIGLDAEDIIDRYEINRSNFVSANRANGRKRRTGEKMLKRLFLSVFFLVALGGGTLSIFHGWEFFFASQKPPQRTSPSQAVAASKTGHTPSQSLVLTMDAIEETWIKINIDGDEPLEYLLSPKDHVELEAGQHYHMLIGNAGALKMKLNGEPVKIPGKSGEVTTLELPKPESE